MDRSEHQRVDLDTRQCMEEHLVDQPTDLDAEDEVVQVLVHRSTDLTIHLAQTLMAGEAPNFAQAKPDSLHKR